MAAQVRREQPLLLITDSTARTCFSDTKSRNVVAELGTLNLKVGDYG
jgi:hypothetical protein